MRQFEKVHFAIDVIEGGIVIEVSFELQLNASSPIEVTEEGIVIEVRLVNLEISFLSIEVMEGGIIIEVSVRQCLKTCSLMHAFVSG